MTILNFGYTTGQSLTAQLFELGSDVVIATASSVTEATNRKGRYAATFSDVDAGDYLLIYFLIGTAAGSEYFTVAGTDGESLLPWSEQGPSQQAAAVLAAAAATPIRADMRLINGEPPQPLGYDPAKEETVQEVLNRIAGMFAPGGGVNASGVGIKYITRGDSYDGVGNPALTWPVARDFTDGWTGTMTIRHRVTRAVLMSVVVTAAASDMLSASLSTDDTAFPLLVSASEFGPHPYDVQMVKGTSQATPVPKGVAIIVSDRTT